MNEPRKCPTNRNCQGCIDCEGTSRVYGYALLREGGKWLGAARAWLQHKRTTKGVQGDQIKWGDSNARFELSAADVEELAAEVAAAAFNEQGDLRKQLDRLRDERFQLQSDLEYERARGNTFEGRIKGAIAHAYQQVNTGEEFAAMKTLASAGDIKR